MQGSAATRSLADPLRLYVLHAARTPLLQPSEERILAQRMVRLRILFLNVACGVPEVWLPAAVLAQAILRGKRSATAVLDVGGLSEVGFRAHLRNAVGTAPRLRTVIERGGNTAHAEARDLVRGLKLRPDALRGLLQAAQRSQAHSHPRRGRDWPLRRALAVHRAYVRTRNALVLANLRLVIHVAKERAPHPSQLPELVQEGNVGLLHATEKYDARQRCRFGTYAYWWIRQSITRALSKRFRLIREPVRLGDTPKEMREAVDNLRSRKGRDPTSRELASKLGIPLCRAQRAFRIRVHMISLDQMKDGESPPAAFIAAPEGRSRVDERDQTDGVLRVLDTLSARQREVVQMRYGIGCDDEYTLRELARIFNLSHERIRQIEQRALTELRKPSRAAPLRLLQESLR